MPENPDSHNSQTSARWLALLIFVVAAIVIFLQSSRWVSVFDEGITLTSAMRVAAGQAIHRDFFIQYGPANLYIIATLFKIFGQSVLVARAVSLVEAASMVAVIFMLLDRFAGRAIALATVIGYLLWPDALSWMTLTMVLSTWLIATNFHQPISRKTAFFTGLLAGSTVLFRYDVGFSVAIVQILLLLAAAILHHGSVRPALRDTLQKSGPYLGGFALLVVPLFVWYAADGIIPGWIYDVFTYSSRHYYAGRNLPFPRIHRQTFGDIIVYVFPLLIALSLFLVLRYLVDRRKSTDTSVPRWVGPVLSFGVIAALSYLKAVVRISADSLFLCTAPCIILAAVLVASRRSFNPLANKFIAVLLALIVLGGASAQWQNERSEHNIHSSMAAWIFARHTQAPYPPFRSWCSDGNPLSKGFCYFDDNDHIEAIEYIEGHTKPWDTLYVGLPQHERIFAGDNVTYFATQRLPAVNWDQLDPFLENLPEIQTQMIAELEKNRPPYIVLDSEFEGIHEPNGSSVSTGEHLLDDYIAAHYTFDVRFGELTILKRNG